MRFGWLGVRQTRLVLSEPRLLGRTLIVVSPSWWGNRWIVTRVPCLHEFEQSDDSTQDRCSLPNSFAMMSAIVIIAVWRVVR